MKNILKNRTALSTVVTTLIILVVSVLLAGVVTYFAINVTSTRVQEESLHLTKQHIWADAAAGTAQAAIMIVNTGGRDVVLDKITCRGQESSWSDVPYNSSLASGETMTLSTHTLTFAAASNDLTIKSGTTLILYVNNPDSISMNDIGITVSLTVFTSQAMYYKETNVEAA
jgi:hypothetical protein